jgi:SAM-dependent methyltransferase
MTKKEPEAEASKKNTYIFDADNAAEFTRLLAQDRFITRAMGGACAGWPELPEDAKILDLACGSGGWVLDVAYEWPKAEVGGVDSSKTMIEYANARARSQGITNASFGLMDITEPLDFANASFDLVHGRFLTGVLKRDAWAPFIAECSRVLRPGGVLQLVEGDDAGRSLSPALEHLNSLAINVLRMAGYGFSPDGRTFGMAPGLLRLLKQAGYHDLHLSTSTLNLSAASEGWADYYHNQIILLLEIKSILIQRGLITENEFDAYLQQATIDLSSDDFAAVGQITSLRGRK